MVPVVEEEERSQALFLSIPGKYVLLIKLENTGKKRKEGSKKRRKERGRKETLLIQRPKHNTMNNTACVSSLFYV